jgi:hypothetical protein
MEPGCMAGSHTNNLPTPTDLTENQNGKKTPFLEAANRPRWLNAEPQYKFNHRGRFLKNVLMFEILGGRGVLGICCSEYAYQNSTRESLTTVNCMRHVHGILRAKLRRCFTKFTNRISCTSVDLRPCCIMTQWNYSCCIRSVHNPISEHMTCVGIVYTLLHVDGGGNVVLRESGDGGPRRHRILWENGVPREKNGLSENPVTAKQSVTTYGSSHTKF